MRKLLKQDKGFSCTFRQGEKMHGQWQTDRALSQVWVHV